MNKLISVIIPTYNRAGIIVDAINTVLNQTYQHFEIIIIDDGSNDNTNEVIKNINDSRIRYVYQENSGRPSLARNSGIKIAKGEYIAFLDSDDLWHPQMLEKHINVMNENNDVGFSTNWSSYRTFEGEELFKKNSYAKNKNEYIRYILLTPDKAYAGTGTILVKKECFDKVGLFDEDLTYCEDWDMFCRIAMIYEFYNIEEVLTYVRVHDASLSKNPNPKIAEYCYLKFLQKAFENENLSSEFFEIKNSAYSNALLCIGGWALYGACDYSIARKSFIDSIKYSNGKVINIKFLVSFILAFSPSLFLKLYKYFKKIYKKILGKNV